MSIEARDWAYSQTLKAPAKPVLVALAERADSRGRNCWPSIAQLAEMTGYGKSSVKRALVALEEQGLVERIRSKGGRTSSYVLRLGELAHSGPVEGRGSGNQLAQRGPVTGPERTSQLAHTDPKLAQRDPLTVNNRHKPSEPSKGKRGQSGPIELPDWVPSELWTDFLDHRKAMKSRMTDTAQTRAVKKLERMRADGQDIEAVIEQSIINGWKGLFPVKTDRRQSAQDTTFSRSIEALQSIFGEQQNGEEDISGGDGVYGRGVFCGNQPSESRRVLGSGGADAG